MMSSEGGTDPFRGDLPDWLPGTEAHDLRHGVAMEMPEQHHDLEQVHALLGHQRLDTTQIYTTIRPQQLKRAVAFYERQAARMLASEDVKPIHVRGTFQCSQNTERRISTKSERWPQRDGNHPL